VKSYRKLLRKIYIGLGTVAASLFMHGCPATNFMAMYGPGPDPGNDIYLTGTVFCKETNTSIPGINVSLQGTDHYDRTDKNGGFFIYVPERLDKHILEFEDVDGPYNGGLFKTKIKEINNEYNYHIIEVYLDKDNDE